ncbi:hypothetical protein ACJJTC_002164 [Scirpophaga incertulas]
MESSLCRVCLDNTASISIFEIHDNIQYCTKIMKCVHINITEDDGLPKFLCDCCVKELDISYAFIIKCETTEKALRLVGQMPEHDVKSEIDIKDEGELVIDDSFLSDIEADQSSNQDFSEETLTMELTKLESVPIESDTEHREQKKKKGGKKVKKRSVPGSLQCVICAQSTLSRSAMEAHMRTHTGEKPFQCKVCKSWFRTKGSLKRHIETRHSDRERKFTCEMCGSSFYRKNDIIIHMRVHTDERPYHCSYCSKRFRQIATLIRHKRVHTGEKPYDCPICGKKFSDKALVKKHQSVHSDERKFTCHLCSKSVKTRNALSTHMTLHTNEKHNICSFCGTAFSMKAISRLIIRRVHSEKSGQCSVCFKTFSDLQVHMRKHTGEKTILNAQGLSPTAMMLEFHLLKQHTNNTPYICQHCSRGFFRTSDLSRHLRVSHMDAHLKIPIVSDPVIL